MTALSQDAALSAALPALAFAFVLALCRAGAVVMLLPGLGEIEAPGMLRAGLASSLAVLLAPTVAVALPPAHGLWSFGGMIGAELVTGCALGWLARLPVLALSICGAVVSTASGLTSVLQPDPALGGQSSALARGLGLAAPVLVLVTGLYALPVSALAESYRMFPPGQFMPSGPLADSITEAVASMFGVAVRLSAPFLIASLLLQTALGLLAKLIPQLQVYTMAVPGQILGGVALLGLLAAPVASGWLETIGSAWLRLPGL